MAINQFGKGKSLAWTGASGPTSPLGTLQSYDTNEEPTLGEAKLGLARVKTYYQGDLDGYITIETPDMLKGSAFKVGQIYTNVILTCEGAKDGAGTAVGDDMTVTLSQAIVTEVGSLSKDNADSAPVVRSVTFRLHRAPGDESDPTYVLAASGS